MARADPELTDDPAPADAESSGRLQALTGRSRARIAVERARAAEQLARHEHRPLVDVVVRLYHRDRESAGTVVGSAIAFRLFLFFVPMLLFLVGLAGFLSLVVTSDDVSDGAGLTGTMAEQLEAAFEQPNSTRWVATLLGLFGMITTGRSLSRVLVSASSLAWRLPVTTKASVKVIGSIVGLFVGIGLLSSLLNRVRAELGIAVAGVSFVAVFGIYAVGWLLVSLVLPRATSDPGTLLPGAVLMGGTLAGMQAVSQLYLPDRIGRASALYGAFGTTIVTLGWFFLIGRAMVLGMALDAVVHERFGGISRFVFSLPVLRALPRRFPRLRRFFGLEG